MFQHFTHSVGVANIRRFEAQLQYKPRYVTQGERGAGFADISKEFGAFLLYMAVILILFGAKFFSARRAMLKRQAQDELHRQKMQQLSLEESAVAGQAE